MPHPLDYQSPASTPTPRPFPLLGIVSWLALAASVTVEQFASRKMNPDRIYSEGGSQYFREHYPAAAILLLGTLAVFTGLFPAASSSPIRFRPLWIIGTILSMLWCIIVGVHSYR